MKFTIIFYSIAGFLFASLLILLFLKLTENKELLEQFNKLNDNIIDTSDQISINSHLTLDLIKAKEDLEILKIKNNQQNSFWTNFINREKNDITELQIKSTSYVQAEITRLISYLRSRCKSSKVLVFQHTNNQSFTDAFGTNAEISKDFSFGLNAYDGHWPNFTKDETHLLLQQALIIKSIVEFLITSASSENKIELQKILRDSVGEVDDQYIELDRIDDFPVSTRLTKSTLLNGFAFTVQFIGNTSNARSFINQLRPPFSLRNFSVQREKSAEPNISTFGDPNINFSQSDDSKILPIIRDVRSKFTLHIEYITSISNNLKSELNEKTGISNQLINQIFD